MMLEIGCGDNPTGNASVRIDVTKGAANILADGQHLPFRNDVFDSILMLEVIEHVSHPFDLILEIRRVLKPNGKIWLSTPNIMQYRRFFRWLFFEKTDVHLDHVHAWGLPELRQLTERAGMKVARIAYHTRNNRNKDPLGRILPRVTQYSILVEIKK